MRISQDNSISFNANSIGAKKLVSQSEPILRSLAMQNKIHTVPAETENAFVNELAEGLLKIKEEFGIIAANAWHKTKNIIHS